MYMHLGATIYMFKPRSKAAENLQEHNLYVTPTIN
jgi:hypothetical protein